MDGLGINSRHLLAPTVAFRTLEKVGKRGVTGKGKRRTPMICTDAMQH